MAQQVESASIEASEQDPPGERPPADIPASPATLWASESKVHYSITHTAGDTPAWIDCDCVIHND
ncbi:hypothetical protein L0U85_20025 [Glycomyces sp. L485]|uniref:hypothetical protein n=1 Tax=Glycomyces sp. L485 TaxID=2909235 RepID=UPI001F4A3573|nr:hypothetical protein [Glycomyces sp. L485]MCH7233126.1 hypothetical protein [Glycomyces sp. L485]